MLAIESDTREDGMAGTARAGEALIGGATLALALVATANMTPARSEPFAFEARAIVAISDADMVASAYVDGALGPRAGEDRLSLIRPTGRARDWTAVEVAASNSVAGPPAAVALSPDGRTAIVVETLGARPAGDGPHVFADLPVGRTIRVFDVGGDGPPKLVQQVTCAERPDAVRFNAAGSIVAVTFSPTGGGGRRPLALYPFAGGRLGEPVLPDVPGWSEGERMIDVDWHPQQNKLAAIETTGGARLHVYDVAADLTLAQNGNVVDIERAPYRVLFTPDGRHVVINALYWGPDIAGTWIEAPRGSVVTVRLDAERRADGSVRHALIGRAMTGVSPEGLAVSPDGEWIVTTNLERSYLPVSDPRFTRYSSLTLIRLDTATGALARIGDFYYEGILPEAAAFDAASRALAVATFEHFDDGPAGGAIDFWRLHVEASDWSGAKLIKTGISIPVTRGVHSLAVAR
ncbi:MAG: hypothetical protein NW205_08105 [Hyphomicrobiaceae bacterium]|nr:hypothetical protein [Hyphomicrobiaceae bacterium]